MLMPMSSPSMLSRAPPLLPGLMAASVWIWVEVLNHGLEGKDSLSIAGGTFVLTCGKDGLRSENTEDASLGSVYIQNGEFQIDAQGDAVSASGALQVDGGTFSTDTADDSIHAGGDISITAGTFQLQSGDDAIHSDSNLLIQDGDFTIPYCYEGLEGLSITIDGGTFRITSQDDGLNAAGGADSSGFGMRQQDQFASSASSDSFILINGSTAAVSPSPLRETVLIPTAT